MHAGRWVLWLLASVAALPVGCGDGKEKLYDVSGTVTYHDKPVPLGTVFFDPDVTQGASGTQGFATIRDGRFSTALDGRGVRGGPHVLRVQGFDGKTANEAPYGQPLFAEYLLKRDLPKEDSTLEIKVPLQKTK